MCIQKCTNRPDESGCQIRCGDLYADAAVKAFNTCAVSTKKCVPQRADEGTYPVPPRDAVVPEFNVADMEGRWYISAGLNPLFDIFPCQVHYFTSPEAGKMFVKVNWRVARANGQFYERSDLQRFVQDPENPAALYNHGNEMLHYQDDWYVLAFKAEKYSLVYYRGSNDAWDGYGGAVLYTRAATVDPADIPELSAAVERVGLKWESFVQTDNTCGPEPKLKVTAPTDLDALVDDVVALEQEAVDEVLVLEKEAADEVRFLEDSLVSFSRGFTILPGKGGASGMKGDMSPEAREAAATLAAMERRAEGGGLFGFLSSLFGGGK